MGKCVASLLILAAGLLSPNETLADEQVRRVQEELRKRHFFQGNANGEKGDALTAAVRRYQLKKGFPATGLIDSVTLASLGVTRAIPSTANTPFATGTRGQTHGANGERLPSPASPWLNDQVRKFDPAAGNYDHFELGLEDSRFVGFSPSQTFPPRSLPTNAEDRKGAPFQVNLDLTNERVRQELADPVWNTVALAPPAEGSDDLALIAEEHPRQAASRPHRRPQRQRSSARARKETNPFVLTYQSVDRAIRSLFGDTQTKKKRSTAKRL